MKRLLGLALLLVIILIAPQLFDRLGQYRGGFLVLLLALIIGLLAFVLWKALRHRE